MQTVILQFLMALRLDNTLQKNNAVNKKKSNKNTKQYKKVTIFKY